MARLRVESSGDELPETKDIIVRPKGKVSTREAAEGGKRVISGSSKNAPSERGMMREKTKIIPPERATKPTKMRDDNEEEEISAPKPKSRALPQIKKTKIVLKEAESSSIPKDETQTLTTRSRPQKTASRNPPCSVASKEVHVGEDKDIKITVSKAKPWEKETGNIFEEMKGAEALDALVDKPKPKKRILKQTTENPLLRPFASTTSSRSSEVSVRKSSSKIAVVEEIEIIVKTKSKKEVLPELLGVKKEMEKVGAPEAEDVLEPKGRERKLRIKSVEDSETDTKAINNKGKDFVSKPRRALPPKARKSTMRGKTVEDSESESMEAICIKEKGVIAEPKKASSRKARIMKGEAEVAEESEVESFVTAMSGKEEILPEPRRSASPKRRKLKENVRIVEDSEDEEPENPEEKDDLPELRRGSSIKEIKPKEKPKVPKDSDNEGLPSIITKKKRIPVEPKPTGRKAQSNTRHVIDESETEDDMSAFIVDDDSSCFVVEDDVESEAETVKTPPKSVRRLVRGRRPARDDTDDDDLEERLERLNFRIDKEDDIQATVKKIDFDGGHGKEKSDETVSRGGSNDIESKNPRTKMDPPLKKKSQPPSSDLEDPFAMRFLPKEMKPKRDLIPKKKLPPPPSSDLDDPFTLRYSPSQAKPKKVSKEPLFTTPPSSPELNPREILSPAKRPLSKIPASPHKQDSDAFWSQDVVNDWNDEYSPQKPALPSKPKFTSTSPGTLLFSPTKKVPVKVDKAARDAKKAFSDRKHALAESFLHELDEKITQGRIAQLSSSTGGIKIIWSKKLNTTAGRANWKREALKSSSNPILTYRHHAAIELAEKVIDDEDRLLNVIAHEYCHLANFMISNIKINPHGKEFKAWASKVSREFGGRGIEVTTKHSYVINYKYIWNCTSCSLEYKRHSKSIDPARHRCGTCKSALAQVKPVPRKGGLDGKGITGYQAFVKEHMKKVREENPTSPQKDIMGLVGKRYQEFKKTMNEKEEEGGEVGGKEEIPDDGGLEGVARKLDFLHLSP